MSEVNNNLYSIKVQIFDFIDFRDYLAKVITLLRSENKKLTYRQLSTQFGFKSPNFLLLLTQKKRKMSIETADKISKILNLNKLEKEYFLLMVKSILASDVQARELITKRMLQIQRGRQQTNLEPQLYELYENWYQVVLREILNLKNIPQNSEFISNFFEEKITEKQISIALEKLSDLSLIEKRGKNWVNKSANLKTGDFFSNTFIILFHKKMLALAEKSLEVHTANERYLSALTLPISEASHLKIRELIEDFKAKALEITEEDSENNRVMQLNLQFFPLTKVYHEKN